MPKVEETLVSLSMNILSYFKIQTLPEITLLAHLLKVSQSEVLQIDVNNLSTSVRETIQKQVLLLRKGYPLDYLLGKISFLNQSFLIYPQVLIPREETEWWLEQFICHLSQQASIFSAFPTLLWQECRAVDLGCGSGIIGCSIAKYFEKIYLVDNSPGALVNTQDNLRLQQIQNAEAVESDLLSVFIHRNTLIKPWILLANLPYVPVQDQQSRTENNLAFEPESALYSENNGLLHFQRTLTQLNALPSPNLAIFELDPRNIQQAQTSLSLLFKTTAILIDQSNNPRVLIGHN